MKIIYRAENAIDANLVRDLLAQEGIQAFVNGGMLQGGVGELPVTGLVNVTVADEDVAAASKVVDEFQHAPDAQKGRGETRWDPSDELLDWKG